MVLFRNIRMRMVMAMAMNTVRSQYSFKQTVLFHLISDVSFGIFLTFFAWNSTATTDRLIWIDRPNSEKKELYKFQNRFLDGSQVPCAHANESFLFGEWISGRTGRSHLASTFYSSTKTMHLMLNWVYFIICRLHSRTLYTQDKHWFTSRLSPDEDS